MRRAGREEPDAIDVELVETWSDDEVLEPPEPPAPGEPRASDGTGASHRRWSWRRRVVAGAVVGVVVATFVGVGVFQDARREAARQEALARSPELLAPIDGPLDELWRVDDGGLVAEAAGLMILGTSGPPDGTGTVQAVEPFTGDVVWQYQRSEQGAGYSSCTALPPAGTGAGADSTTASLLACMDVADVGVRGLGNWEPSVVVYVLDAHTGGEVLRTGIDGSPIMWTTFDGDVAVLLEQPDGHVTAARISVPDGNRVWTFRSDEPLMSVDGNNVVWGAWPEPGRFILQGEPGLVLDLDTGEPVPGPRVDGLPTEAGPPTRTALPDGGTAEWSYSPSGTDSGRVLDADGSVRFALAGPVSSIVSDDSEPDRIVIEPPGSRTFWVIDSASGETVWEGEISQWPVARLDGILVVASYDALRGFRVRDGALQWTLPAAGLLEQPVLTDGRVLLIRRDAGSQGIMAAVDPRDGSVPWQMNLPDGVSYLTGTQSGAVVGYGPEEMIVFG